MKRKMFAPDVLTRMAGYTALEIAAVRKELRTQTDTDEYQDEAIGRLQSLQAQAADIARNIEALKTKTPRAARTKTAKAGTRRTKRTTASPAPVIAEPGGETPTTREP